MQRPGRWQKFNHGWTRINTDQKIMRTKILLLSIVGTVMALWLSSCGVAVAQGYSDLVYRPAGETPAVPGAGETPALPGVTTLDKVFADIGRPTNYAVEPYFTYAPKAPQHYGGGILGIVNMDQYVGIGLGLDWLGHLSLVSANVQLQAPFHPMPKTFPNLLVDPFVIGGAGTAYTGAGHFNGGVSTIADIGGAVKFGHVAGGQMNVGVAWGQWTGVGPYDVKRYHVFLGWSHGF
jgi:hypothetical protein